VAQVRCDGFAPAEPLPGAVNTPGADEFDATFLADGTSIVFSRSTDVYFAARAPAGCEAGSVPRCVMTGMKHRMIGSLVSLALVGCADDGGGSTDIATMPLATSSTNASKCTSSHVWIF
jgi:hypothetical protein